MAKQHKSNRGVVINMEEMRAKNESAVAVTGRGATMRMNARGDTLLNGGRVDRRREDIEQDYNQLPSGKAKRSETRAVEADTFETPQEVMARMARQAAIPPLKSQAEASKDVEAPKNVAGRPGARKLSEKDD